MKKILLFLCAAVAIFIPLRQSLATTEARAINVGAFENYPLIFKDTDGVVKGMYVDVLTEIGKKENIYFKYLIGSWSEGLDRIKSGEVDMLTSVAYSEERSLFMDYHKNPILTVWGELYIPEWSEIDSILEVSDKTVGVMAGDINAKNFKDLVSQFNINCQFVEFSSYDDVFRAVEEKKVDAGIAGITFGNANKDKYNLKKSGVVFNPLDLYFATAKGRNQDLVSIFDKHLSNWKIEKNSFLAQSQEKWMNDSLNTTIISPTWLYLISGILGFLFIAALVLVFFLKTRIRLQKEQLKKVHSFVSDKEKSISDIKK
ncbi:MAG: transporter substrate-binding domain-containing protein [Candidatus Falkowbacteria bacterium]